MTKLGIQNGATGGLRFCIRNSLPNSYITTSSQLNDYIPKTDVIKTQQVFQESIISEFQLSNNNDMKMTVFQGLKEINVCQNNNFVIIFIGIFLIEKCQQLIQR